LEVVRALLILLAAAPAWAAFCSPGGSLGTTPSKPRHDFQFFAGYSPVSATLIGTTTDRRFFMAGFGYSYRCWAWPGVSISYSGELLPAAVLLQPGQFLPPFVPAHAVYGFAVTPVGFTIDFGRHQRIYPFLETNEGIIASSEPIPINVTGATGLNFLIDVGGGIRMRMGQRRRDQPGLQVSAYLQRLHQRREPRGGQQHLLRRILYPEIAGRPRRWRRNQGNNGTSSLNLGTYDLNLIEQIRNRHTASAI